MEEKKSFSWENGDVAELADGERAIYLDGFLYCYKDGEESGYTGSGGYTPNLRSHWTKEFDIIKVWRYTSFHCTNILADRIKAEHLRFAEVVFCRPQEMTLAEVCEALGKNIVIVKED